MRKLLLFMLTLCAVTPKIKAQTWQPLGSDEQTNQPVALTAANVTYTAVDASGTPYISFIDDMPGSGNAMDFKVHVKKFVNNQWIDLGGVSTEIPSTDYFPIACDVNQLYLAYSESATSSTGAGRITVKKYNATSNEWQYVGAPAFSVGQANYIGITAANGKVYVAYTDDGMLSKVVVKVFDNGNVAAGWQTLGTAPISLGTVGGMVGNNINLAVDNNEVYAAYIDFGVNNGNGGLMVKRFSNGAWLTAGNGLASGTDRATNAKLRFDADHNAYVSYINPVTMELKVRLLFNNLWLDFNNNTAATNVKNNSSFTIINNTPYVSYVSANNGEQGQAYVKKFNSTSSLWEDVGSQPVTASSIEVNDVNLVADAAGILHLNFHNFNSAFYAKSFNTSGTLPVTWKSFTVEKLQNKALLKWTVVNEVNNKLFVVEHSTTGQRFTKAAEVPAAIANSKEGYYNFTTAALDKGIHYFRLQQVDKDGAFTYSPVTNITISAPGETALKIYPNPVKETLFITGSVSNNAQVVISTSEGKFVKKALINNNRPQLNVGELTAGKYFITIYDEGQKQTLSFVK